MFDQSEVQLQRLNAMRGELEDVREALAASHMTIVALRRELAVYRERDARAAIVQHAEDKAKLNGLSWDGRALTKS